MFPSNTQPGRLWPITGGFQLGEAVPVVAADDLDPRMMALQLRELHQVIGGLRERVDGLEAANESMRGTLGLIGELFSIRIITLCSLT